MQLLTKTQLKWIRSLQLKKNREAEEVFVVEGEKMVLEGIAQRLPDLKMLLAANDYQLDETLFPDKLFRVGKAQLEQVSTLKTPNKLIAIFNRPQVNFPEKGLLLALDDIQDPGNMGTILRLADWFGVRGILCSENTVDCYNPKVIQSSMGAIFRIPVLYCALSQKLAELQLPVYGALLDGENYTTIRYPEDAILLMGNEGNGIAENLKRSISKAVTIPRFGQAESLNVATATAILLAEIKR